MALLWMLGGAAWMIAAVLADPWGQKPWAAVMFIAGAAMFGIGIGSGS